MPRTTRKRPKFRYTTCNCGWVYFGVSRKYAEAEVKSFNKYFESLPDQQKLDFYGNKPSSVKNYEHCYRCGNHYKNFRRYKKGDVGIGHTINPIIFKKD